ncbi:hypothetical protein MMC18_004422 [Xylographa bjoerkii]|nr:hypothetical protein [Xylographa bjoerkii]
MNIAQHLPVEIIREILRHVKPAYMFNAISICREWLEAGKDILTETLDNYAPGSDLAYRTCTRGHHCLYLEQTCLQGNEEYVRLAKWQEAASKRLSWYQAGHHTVKLSLWDDLPEQTTKNGPRLFASANGRFLLRNEVSTNRVRNSLFSTEDVRSFVQLGKDWRHVRGNRTADIAYHGDEIIAEDVQPSFITALPPTAPLVDVSFYQHREPSLILSSYRNWIPDDHKVYDQPIRPGRLNPSFPCEHCVDIAMLSEEREVHLLTVTLKQITPKKMPFQKLPETSLEWRITGQGSISDVCQGRGPLNAILLDVTFEAVVVACHDGVEIICLHPREASPGDKLRGSTRKWINMFGQGPGPVITITESRNEIFLLTKARTSTEPVSERIAGLTFSFNPLWDQKSLAWSHPVANSTSNGIPRELQSITPVSYSDLEYVLWNPARKCIELVYVSTSHAHLRPYVIAQLQDPMWSGELRPPSRLAAVYHHQEDIIIASYRAEDRPPKYVEKPHHSPNVPESIVAEKHIKEDIYLSQYDATPQSGNIDFYRQYVGMSAHTDREPIPQHYIGSITSPHGIQTIKIDIRHSGGSKTDILHSERHKDFHKRSCFDENDHLVVIVFILNGSNDVVIWYLAKTIKADLLGGRKETWRWKEQKTSSSKDSSRRAKRASGILQPLRKALKQEEHSWMSEADQSIGGWALVKDSPPMISSRHDSMF